MYGNLIWNSSFLWSA